DGDTTIDFLANGSGDTCCLSPSGASEVCAGTVSIDGGTNHSCVVKTGGTALCWGDNSKGQLGSAGGDQKVPALVAGITTGVAIATGGLHTCARLADGSAVCFG